MPTTAADSDTPLDLARIERLAPLQRIRGRNTTKADILVYRHGTLQIALKDYRGCPWWIRATIGRFLVARESRAYVAARGIPGIAPFLGRLGPLTLATEWIEARRLADFGDERPRAASFDALRETLDRLHAAGIALGDLHHRDVLIGSDGEVTLVDLATALVLGERPSALRRRLFQRLRLQDEIAFARMRARFGGADPELAVRALGAAAFAAHRRGRRLKRWFDRLRGRRRAS